MGGQTVPWLVWMEIKHLSNATKTAELAVLLEDLIQVAGGQVSKTNNCWTWLFKSLTITVEMYISDLLASLDFLPCGKPAGLLLAISSSHLKYVDY